MNLEQARAAYQRTVGARPPIVAIRAKVYRDRDGFLIYGRDTSGRHVRMFTVTRSSAERIRAKVRTGEEVTLIDFQP